MAIMQMCPVCPGGLIFKATPNGLACNDCGFIPKEADQNIVDEPEVAASGSSHINLSDDAALPQGEERGKHVLAPSIETEFTRKGNGHRFITESELARYARGGLHVAQRCKFCKHDATKAFTWAEGMAYIPACDKHHQKARDIIVKDNHDEVIAEKPLPKRASKVQDDDLPSPREDGEKVEKTAPAWAIQMSKPFTVDTIEGETDGKADDFLLEGPAGDKWVVDQEIFLGTYGPASEGDEEPSTTREIGGLPIVIEWRKGETRTGQNREGKKWSRKMHADYGYIRDTEGADGEGVDVYIGPHPDSETVFVVEQLKNGKYDEDKCMVGFESESEAEACYRKHYPNDAADFFGDIHAISLDEFVTSYLHRTLKRKDRYKKSASMVKQAASAGNIARILNIPPAVAELFVNADRQAAFALAKIWRITKVNPQVSQTTDDPELIPWTEEWIAGPEAQSHLLVLRQYPQATQEISTAPIKTEHDVYQILDKYKPQYAIAKTLSVPASVGKMFSDHSFKFALPLARLWYAETVLPRGHNISENYLAASAMDWLSYTNKYIMVFEKNPKAAKEIAAAPPDANADYLEGIINKYMQRMLPQGWHEKPQVVVDYGDGYKWVKVPAEQQGCKLIESEGVLARHCGEIQYGDEMYSLRDARNMPMVTIDLDPENNTINQMYGTRNTAPGKQYQKYIDDFRARFQQKPPPRPNPTQFNLPADNAYVNISTPQAAEYMIQHLTPMRDEAMQQMQQSNTAYHKAFAKAQYGYEPQDGPAWQEVKRLQAAAGKAGEYAFNLDNRIKYLKELAKWLTNNAQKQAPAPGGQFEQVEWPGAQQPLQWEDVQDQFRQADIGQSLVTLTEGIEDSRPVDRRDVSEAYHGDNINEDKDLHLGTVLPPYSSGHGPSSTHQDNDLEEGEIKMQNVASIGRGCDPYRVGHIYSYDQLIPQHRHEIDINWKKGRGRHFLWLRTSASVAELIDESERWYNTNRHRKWGFKDDSRVVALAEVILDGGVITPLLISPSGEENGGVWEGYHRLRAADMLDMGSLPVIAKIDPADPYWQEKFAAEDREPWICIDLDGTIIEEDPNANKRNDTRPPLGEPYQGVAEEMKELMNIGRVSIYTARQYFEDPEDNTWKEDIADHLKQHGIPFDDIYVGPKPPADIFIDNKGIRFEGEWAGMADLIRSLLTKQKYRDKPHHSNISMEAALGEPRRRVMIKWVAPDGMAHTEIFEHDGHVNFLHKKHMLDAQQMRYEIIYAPDAFGQKKGQIPPAHVIDDEKKHKQKKLKEEERRRPRLEVPVPPPPSRDDSSRKAYVKGGPGNHPDSEDSYTNIDGSRDDLAVEVP